MDPLNLKLLTVLLLDITDFIKKVRPLQRTLLQVSMLGPEVFGTEVDLMAIKLFNNGLWILNNQLLRLLKVVK